MSSVAFDDSVPDQKMPCQVLLFVFVSIPTAMASFNYSLLAVFFCFDSSKLEGFFNISSLWWKQHHWTDQFYHECSKSGFKEAMMQEIIVHAKPAVVSCLINPFSFKHWIQATLDQDNTWVRPLGNSWCSYHMFRYKFCLEWTLSNLYWWKHAMLEFFPDRVPPSNTTKTSGEEKCYLKKPVY